MKFLNKRTFVVVTVVLVAIAVTCIAWADHEVGSSLKKIQLDVPTVELGATLDAEGRLVILLPACGPQKVSSLGVSAIDANSARLIWRIESKGSPSRLRSVVVGTAPSGYTAEGTFNGSPGDQRYSVGVVRGNKEQKEALAGTEFTFGEVSRDRILVNGELVGSEGFDAAACP